MSMNNPTNSTTRSADYAHKGQPSADTNWRRQLSSPPVCPYDRKRALSDGLQKEVSSEYLEHVHREWDLMVPNRLFLTKKVIETCGIPNYYQEKGPLWEILLILESVFDSSKSNRIPFEFKSGGVSRWLHAVWSKADIDDSTPSITVVMPNED
jgi:hypothetical protein